MMNSSTTGLPSPAYAAERLLDRVEVAVPPVDLLKVVALWPNLSVFEGDLEGEGYLLPVGELGAEILVNKSDKEERKRFTIAHELGHWVLGISLKRKTGHFSQPKNTHYAEIERWCDRFATNLLMPESMIKSYTSQEGGDDDIGSLTHGPSIFKVSEQAFFLRIWEVLRLQVALVSLTIGSGRDSARIEKSFGDPQAQQELENRLKKSDVVAQLLIAPNISFSWPSTNGEIKCFGRRIKPGQVLLVLRWPEEKTEGV
jgi:Zn-dependent peptidase ImmA (M78 family)